MFKPPNRLPLLGARLIIFVMPGLVAYPGYMTDGCSGR